MKELALGVAFLLEVVAIGIYSYAGFHLPVPDTWRFILGIGLPVLVILFWAQYMAPKAPHRLKNPLYIITKSVIFAVAALLLDIIGWQSEAVLFLVLFVLDEAILRRF